MKAPTCNQISMIEYFSKDQEEMPTWLENFKVGQKVFIKDLFNSRIVYNPGAGFEGAPIKTFNASHSAHTFIYVDYGFPKNKVDSELSEHAFTGYHLIHTQDVTINELLSGTPTYHLDMDDITFIKEGYKNYNINNNNSFGILKIYQRNNDLSDEHGASRFAILYLGADAIATYDVLFGNTNCTPFASVIDTYGFCYAYDSFAKGSIMEKIARRTNRLPKYLICPLDQGWDGYHMLKTVGGSYNRFVYVKNN